MEGKGRQEEYRPFRGGRHFRGRGGRGFDDRQQLQQHQGNRNWEERGSGYQGGRQPTQQWRQRDQEPPQRHEQFRNQQFDLRDNLRQTRGNENLEQKQAESKVEEEGARKVVRCHYRRLRLQQKDNRVKELRKTKVML
jgi:hypothetical protein